MGIPRKPRRSSCYGRSSFGKWVAKVWIQVMGSQEGVVTDRHGPPSHPRCPWRLRDSAPPSGRRGAPCSFGEGARRRALLSSVSRLSRSFCLSVSGAVSPSAPGPGPGLSRESLNSQIGNRACVKLSGRRFRALARGAAVRRSRSRFSQRPNGRKFALVQVGALGLAHPPLAWGSAPPPFFHDRPHWDRRRSDDDHRGPANEGLSPT